MSDLLIEGITYEEPKPGLVDKVKDGVKNYILPPPTDTEEIEEKRESGNSCFTRNSQRLPRCPNESW